MLKGLIGLVMVGVLTVMAASTVQQGCADVKRSWTHLDYYAIRDMRRTVVINPQKISMRAPDTLSMPMTGRDTDIDYLRNPDHMAVDLATQMGDRMKDASEGMTDSSVARGERKFMKTCVPCHGPKLAGDGPVAALFMAPPDLLGEATRNRKDGYIFSYIRHGGMVMPPYGAQVTAEEAWDLIHFIRHMQKVSPR
jgi:mono/diheme cytochrome c family protein